MKDPKSDQVISPDPLISETAVAWRWSKSLRTLQRWRYDGSGPAHVRIGNTIFYRGSDIAAFEASCRRIGK